MIKLGTFLHISNQAFISPSTFSSATNPTIDIYISFESQFYQLIIIIWWSCSSSLVSFFGINPWNCSAVCLVCLLSHKFEIFLHRLTKCIISKSILVNNLSSVSVQIPRLNWSNYAHNEALKKCDIQM